MRIKVFCLTGLAVSLVLLITGLPLNGTSAMGVTATVTFLLLNPPMILVMLAAPREVHDLETSIWPYFEYPVAVLVSVVWWLVLLIVLRKIGARCGLWLSKAAACLSTMLVRRK